MFAWLIRILFNADAFQQHAPALGAWWDKVKVPLRAGFAGLTLAVATGQINLGAFGYWAAPVALALSFFVQGGDKVADIAALPDDKKAELADALRPHLNLPPKPVVPPKPLTPSVPPK